MSDEEKMSLFSWMMKCKVQKELCLMEVEAFRWPVASLGGGKEGLWLQRQIFLIL